MDADTATVDAWTSGRLDHVDVTVRACPRTRRRHTAAIFMPRMNGSAFLLFTAPFRARRLEKSCSLSCLCREEGFQVHGKPFSLRRPFFTARDRIVGRSLHGIRNGLSAMDKRASPSALAMAVRNVARVGHLSCGLGMERGVEPGLRMGRCISTGVPPAIHQCCPASVL